MLGRFSITINAEQTAKPRIAFSNVYLVIFCSLVSQHCSGSLITAMDDLHFLTLDEFKNRNVYYRINCEKQYPPDAMLPFLYLYIPCSVLSVNS